MVKGIDFKVGLDSIKKLPKEELVKIPQQVEEAVAKNVKTVGEIPAESIRARYASQLDTAMLNRFKPEPYRIPDFSELSREKQIELLSDAIRQNAPKTKEEAFTRLEYALQQAKKMNVEVPEEAVQQLRNDIIKKFGG